LALPCSSCGFSNEPGEKYCGGCGLALTPSDRSLDSTSHAPHTYTPSYLADKILTLKSALEGERKQVTILFADLKDSTELIRGIDPEAAQRLLDPALQRMMDAVHRFEGTVNQVLGDGIMALFGVPIAHEDHALRACYAALAMQAALRRYAEKAGVKLNPYQARKSFARWMEDAHIPRARRVAYLGHSTADVQDRYERYEIDAYLREDAERMRALIGPQKLALAQ